MADSQDRASFRQSLADALATGDLRRLQLTWTFASIGSWTFFIVLAVYAYDQGGATAVGIAALARMVPAGLAAPLAGMIVDRSSRREVLLASTIGRSFLLAGIAACGRGGCSARRGPGARPRWSRRWRRRTSPPRRRCSRPSPARPGRSPPRTRCSPPSRTWASSPARCSGARSLPQTSIQTAFVVTAGLFALAAWPLARIRRDPIPAHRAHEDDAERALEELASGFRTVAREPDLRLIVGVSACSTLVEGAADVLVVLVAIELLDLGRCGRGLAEQRVGRRRHRGRGRRHLAARARAPRRRARRRLPAGGRRAAGHGRVARGGRGRGNAGGPGRGLQPDRDRGADAAPAPHLRGPDRACVRRHGEQLLDHHRASGRSSPRRS